MRPFVKIVWLYLLFTLSILPRDAMLAPYMLSSCVRLSVRLSVRHTPVLYQTAKQRITQTTPRDSSFLMPKISATFQRRRQVEVG